MPYSIFLRRILMLDAASCLAMGLLLVLGAEALAPLFGLDAGLLEGAGIVLMPFGLFVAGLATRRSGFAVFVYLIVAANLLWAVESAIVIASTNSIQPLGIAFVATQAVAVAGLALLEWIAVRRRRTGQTA